jgi:hypothetical protein
LPWEGLEVGGRVVVARTGDGHVLADDVLALLAEELTQRLLEHREVEAEERHHHAQRERVLDHLVLAVPRERLHRHRAELSARPGRSGHDIVAVEEDATPLPHQSEVPVHGVLVQAHEQVDAVAVAQHLPFTDAEHQQDVPAADDRLVGVVGVEVEAAAGEDAREHVTGRRDALAGGPPDRDGEIEFLLGHGHSSSRRGGSDGTDSDPRGRAGKARRGRTVKVRRRGGGRKDR